MPALLLFSLIPLVCCRYLDSVTNKDSTLPPIPHLHSLLTDNGEPHPEVDIFKLVCNSYEVLHREGCRFVKKYYIQLQSIHQYFETRTFILQSLNVKIVAKN